MLTVALARSSPDDIAICYVLPVLWMMLYFHIMEPVARIKDNVMFCRVRQVMAPGAQLLSTIVGTRITLHCNEVRALIELWSMAERVG